MKFILEFKEIIENRVVGYTWVKDLFIIPADPYGKSKQWFYSLYSLFFDIP